MLGVGVYFHSLGWASLLGQLGLVLGGFPGRSLVPSPAVLLLLLRVCGTTPETRSKLAREKKKGKKRNLIVKMLEMILMTSFFFPL